MNDPVRCVLLTSVALTGTPLVDTVQTAPGDHVLVNMPTNLEQNGPYVIPEPDPITGIVGAWARRSDFDLAVDMVPGTSFFVMEGSPGNVGRWQFTTIDLPILVGTTLLVFEKFAGLSELKAGPGTVVENGEVRLEETGVIPGTYPNSTQEVDEFGRTVYAEGSELFSTFIEGLHVQRIGTNSIRVAEGAAFVPGLGRIVELADFLDKTGLVLTASAFNYVYLIENQGVADLEVSSAVPTAPYRGQARTKGGVAPDNTRRYLGCVLTDSAGQIYNFWRSGSWVRYLADTNVAPFRRLTGGNQTAYTNVDNSACVPPTSRLALAYFQSAGGVTNVNIPGVAGDMKTFIATAQEVFLDLDDARLWRYKVSVGTATLTANVLGYHEER